MMRHINNIAALLVAASACASAPRGAPGSDGYVDPGPPVGPLGAKYKGQVVFHAKPIAYQSADDSSILQRYTLGEPLFIRYWANNSPANVGGPDCGGYPVRVEAKVNGVDFLLNDARFARELERTLVTTSLTGTAETPLTAPWSSHDKTPAQRLFQNGIVAALHEGSNRLDVRVYVDCSANQRDTTIARGSLDIDVPAGAIDTFLATVVPAVPPSPLRDSDKISEEVATSLRAEWNDRKVLGARVASGAWEPIRDELSGRLVRKRVFVEVYFHSNKEPNRQLCQVTTYPVERDVAGGPLLVGLSTGEEPFPCAKAP